MDYRDAALVDLINLAIIRLFVLLLTKGVITADEWPTAVDGALAPLLKPGDPATVTLIGRAIAEGEQAGYAQAATGAHDRIIAAVETVLAALAPPDPGAGG